MKISGIEIRNFRGIEDVSISFENDLICIVGRNDVGKSTVLKAIETFFAMRNFQFEDFPFRSEEGTKSIIEIIFETDNEELEDYAIESKLYFRHTYEKSSEKILKRIECKKKFVPPTEDELNEYKELKKIGTGLGVNFPKRKPDDKSIEELRNKVREKIDKRIGSYFWFDISNKWSSILKLLPEIIIIPAVQDPENEQKMTSDSSAFGSLFRVGIRKLLQHNEKGRKAVDTLQEIIGEMNEDIIRIVKKNLREQGTFIELLQQPFPIDVTKSFSFQMEVEDESGIKTPLSQRGNGLQRAVLMAIIRSQNEINKKIRQFENREDVIKEGEKTTYLYLIEEPEAFLHLSAQRELYYSIKELISDGSQAIITTHSTLFMDEGNIEQIVLLHREYGKTTSSQALELTKVKENIGELVQVSQLMTGKVCCLVEGISDIDTLKVWMKKLGYDYKKLGIYFVDMEGCKNAEYYANVKVIKSFKVKLHVVLDTDFHSIDRAEELKENLIKLCKLRERQITILSKGEIENYFPINKVEEVLKLKEGSINEEEYRIDPKEAIKNARNKSDYNSRKYVESRDARRIASKMDEEEIDEEIIELIHILVKLAEGEIIEQQFEKVDSSSYM